MDLFEQAEYQEPALDLHEQLIWVGLEDWLADAGKAEL